MANVTVTVTGLEAIMRKHSKAAVDAAVQHALESTAQYGADLVKTRLANHTVTGFLRSSIRGSMVGKNHGRTYAVMGSGVNYTPFVEHGTGIYGPRGQRIRPRSAKALAWTPKTVTGRPVKGAGKIVRRSVAGQRPVHMFERTFTEDRSKLVNHFRSAFRSRFVV